MSTARRPRPVSKLSEVTQADEESDTPPLSLARSSTGPTKRFARFRAFWQYQFSFIVCIFLHVVLVVAHAVLVGLSHDGHSVNFVKGEFWGERFYDIVAYSPNAIGKVILVVTVYLTQKLALRRDFHARQSLTSIHDQSSAWLGLGPALITTYKQFSVTEAEKDAPEEREDSSKYLWRLFSVVAILTYVSGVFVLGLTLPTLLDIGFVYDFNDSFENVTSALPVVGNNPDALRNEFAIVNVVPLLDMDVVLYGLQESIVYDVPNFGTGDQPVAVKAEEFHSVCKGVPQASFTGFNIENGTYTFEVSPMIQPIDIVPAPRSLSIVSLKLVDSSQAAPPTMFIASTLPIVDDPDRGTGVSDSFVSFSPSVNEPNCAQASDCDISRIQILACDFNTTQTISNFDPVRIILAEDDNDDVYSWTNWTLLGPPNGTTLSLVHVFNELSPPSDHSQVYNTSVPDGTASWTRNYTLLEDELMDALDYDTLSNNFTDLVSVEYALERAVASVLWRAAITNLHLADIVATQNQTLADSSRYVIKISNAPPIIGLAISIVLLLIAVVMCWQPVPKVQIHSELETPGVLQLIYLSSIQGVVPQNLKAALGDEKTHLDALRAAGKKVTGWSFDETHTSSVSEKAI